MTTSAVIGTGATIEVETSASSSTYQALVGVVGVGPPGASIDPIDATEMGSGRDREFIPGLRDNGEMEVTLHHVAGSATDDFIEAWIAAAELRSVRFTYGNAETVTCEGFPTGYAIETPMDDKQTATLTIKVSGGRTRS